MHQIPRFILVGHALMKSSLQRFFPILFALLLAGAHVTACADGDSGHKNQLVDDTQKTPPKDKAPEDEPPEDTNPGEIPVDGQPDDDINPFEPRSEEHTSELQSRGHLVCR